MFGTLEEHWRVLGLDCLEKSYQMFLHVLMLWPPLRLADFMLVTRGNSKVYPFTF